MVRASVVGFALLSVVLLCSCADENTPGQSKTEAGVVQRPQAALDADDAEPSFTGVLRDWRRRSTWSDVNAVRIEVAEDGRVLARWRSNEGRWAAPELCDFILSFGRGYRRYGLPDIEVVRIAAETEQRYQIPADLAEDYLNEQINDDTFFNRIGVSPVETAATEDDYAAVDARELDYIELSDGTPGLVSRGRHGGHSYWYVEDPAGFYVARFSPPLPRNDEIVVAAFRDLTGAIYGPDVVERLDAKAHLVTGAQGNEIALYGIVYQYLFLPLKNDAGEVHSVFVRREKW